jgi:hypothetical protein
MKNFVTIPTVVLAVVGLLSACEAPQTEADKSPPSPSMTKGPVDVNGPKPVRWGNWQLVSKVKVDADLYGDYTADFRVKNLKDEPDTGDFLVSFYKGDKLLGTTDCSTRFGLSGRQLQPGDVGSVTCMADGDHPNAFKKGWTKITIEDFY